MSEPEMIVRVGAASLNQLPLDWEGNRGRILAAVEEARSERTQLLLLPELAITGYGCEDMFYAYYVQKQALESLFELAPATKGMVVVAGLPLMVESDGKLSRFNVAAVIDDGQVAGFYCKQFMADDGIHYEPRWFKPWFRGEVSQIQFEGESYPVGDLLFDWGPIRIGIEVCRDAWVKDRPACHMKSESVGMVLNPSASHFAFGKQDIRRRLVKEGSALISGAYAYVNLLGNESGRSIYDGGSLFAYQGEMVVEGKRFSYADHTLTTVDMSVPTRDSKNDSERVLQLVHQPSKAEAPATEKQNQTPASKEEELTRAVPLGLFDYLRKTRSKGFVLSLSGGADSSAVAVMVSLMVEQATAELGVEQFAKRIGMSDRINASMTIKEVVAVLLTTVYQSTENSSETTREAASEVAAEVGATHREWAVDGLIDGYIDRVTDALGRELAWETDDLALQNIQARARAPGVWMIANVKNFLLLTTGNRSEASVGYMTMDGDTAGGLAPLAGIDKAYLREWLRWLALSSAEGIRSYPALSFVNAQQPTAELRPDEAAQTDETDLMPYDVLDAIESSAIERLEPPQKTLEAMQNLYPNYTSEQLEAWISKFWRLWKVSQWKRERLAPSFHLDTMSVDPKTWRRYPILSHVE